MERFSQSTGTNMKRFSQSTDANTTGCVVPVQFLGWSLAAIMVTLQGHERITQVPSDCADCWTPLKMLISFTTYFSRVPCYHSALQFSLLTIYCFCQPAFLRLGFPWRGWRWLGGTGGTVLTSRSPSLPGHRPFCWLLPACH